MAAAQTPSAIDLITTTTVTAAASSTTSSGSAILLTNDGALVQCPNCDKKLHPFEVASHCEQEMQRLKQKTPLLSGGDTSSPSSVVVAAPDEEEEGGTTSSNDPAAERRKPWSVFQRVQRNRQSRMKQRTRKRPAIPEHPCPVCNVNFPQDEIQQHAEECLRRSNRTANGRSNSEDHSSNDDEGGGEEYEEYEWAGQKRIRVSSLLQGGYAAIGIGQSLSNGSSVRLNGHTNQDEDDDEDLNVDEDDTQIYGPTQYAENDVIPSHIMNEDESDVTSYMRRLITAGSSSATNVRNTNTTTTTDSLNLNSSIIKNSSSDISADVMPASSSSLTSTTTTTSNDPEPPPSTPAHYQQIIDSLKAKLRHYEQQYIPGKYKCLICLDDYRNPAISVACWHVHCEQCWLRSLGSRKLCPQCNLITTPKDLRRIYM